MTDTKMTPSEIADLVESAILAAIFGDRVEPVTFAQPLAFTVGKGEAAIALDFASLPVASIARAVRRGIQEDLNNAKASFKDNAEGGKAAVLSKADDYRNADFRRTVGERGATQATAESVAREALGVMIANAKKANPKYSLTKEDKAKALAAIMGQNGKTYAAEAERRNKANAAAAESILNIEGATGLAALGITLPGEDKPEDKSAE